jgi:hypothetical protein
VKEKREEIINFLDKLERQMLDNISAIESKTRQRIKMGKFLYSLIGIVW